MRILCRRMFLAVAEVVLRAVCVAGKFDVDYGKWNTLYARACIAFLMQCQYVFATSYEPAEYND